ncbi:hypothetical protein PIB30_089222 [Stylosanthes scabra]|uniref:Uncharacterized protein n=1 Tax=Stylosanthes scabra TaxID=79078 RepID=A0ABU6TTG5_9FABA|nr:hypothetical protein [Stylosanthes scabra]
MSPEAQWNTAPRKRRKQEEEYDDGESALTERREFREEVTEPSRSGDANVTGEGAETDGGVGGGCRRHGWATGARTQASRVEYTTNNGGYSSKLRWNVGDGEGSQARRRLGAAQNGGGEVVGDLEGLTLRGESDRG